MRIKKCWVESCESSADREKDKGVTFHKLPKDDSLRAKWMIQTRLDQNIDRKNCWICSRHFRRVDFEAYKACIFTLKADAIPTIFPWGATRLEELEEKFSKLDVPVTSTSETNIESISKATENSDSLAEMSAVSENDKKNIKSKNEESLNSSEKIIEAKKDIKSPKSSKGEKLDDIDEIKKGIKSESSKGEKIDDIDEIKKGLKTPISSKGEKLDEIDEIKKGIKSPKSSKSEKLDDIDEIRKGIKSPESSKGEKLDDIDEIQKGIKSPKSSKSEKLDDIDEIKEKTKSSECAKSEKLDVIDEIKEEIKSPKSISIDESTVENDIKSSESLKTEEVINMEIIKEETKSSDPLINTNSADSLNNIEGSDTTVKLEIIPKIEDSELEKHPPTDVSDFCGKESEETEESQSDSDHKNSDLQENLVPEIETILENIFGPDDMSMLPIKNANVDEDEKLDDDPIDDPNKSLRDILSQPIKQISKITPKAGNIGRPKRRSPLTPKHTVKSKPKSLKQKWLSPKTIVEEKPEDIVVKQEKGVLVQGARVEAKDFNDIWYPARVVEVDHDEMEVLIHYDNWSQRFDEWIYMWSPRIRVVNPAPPPPSKATVYEEGERCYARWSNNQRFICTVQKVLPNGQYEVLFDDGFVRTTKSSMMAKCTMQTSRGSTTPCIPNASVQNVEVTSPPIPSTPLHNHLFDPKRDHLGTKEERRNLKKKIDVKELFSRKKKKVESVSDVKCIDTSNKEGRGRKRKIKSEDESTLKDTIQKVKKKEPQIKVEIDDSIKQEVTNDSAACSTPKDVTLEKLHNSILCKQLHIQIEKPFNSKLSNQKSTSSPSILPNNTIQQVISNPPIKLELDDSPNIITTSIEIEPIPIKEEIKTISPISTSQNIFTETPILTTANNCQSPTLISRLLLKPIGDNASVSSVDNTENYTNAKQVLPKFNVRAGDKDWCCKWLNDQPVGTLIESESQVDRITIQVADHRLPPGWRKLLTKKRGTESTKWDVVIICPDGRRYRTRGEMQERLMEADQAELEPFASGLLDFSAHRKQSRRKGWDVKTSKSIDHFNSMSEEQQQYVFNKKKSKKRISPAVNPVVLPSPRVNLDLKNSSFQGKDFIYVGSLKVQVIENLLRCPKEGCFKNFRKDNLLQMHIKHYHPEMCKFFGDTPNVADLAYARIVVDEPSPTSKTVDRYADVAYGVKKESEEDLSYNQSWCSPSVHTESVSDYPFQQNVYTENKSMFSMEENEPTRSVWEEKKVICNPDTLKLKFFLTKPDVKRSHKRKVPEHYDESRLKKKRISDHYMPMSDYDETRSSFGMADHSLGRSYDPNCSIKSEHYPKIKEEKEDSNQSSTIITESGEKIKIVHMKREEIINCHCGFGEEDGLMIQCELCLCWQHALCHNIEKESEVPDKYVCLICLQPYRGRRSQKHLHAQEWLYEGRLPRATPTDSNADIVRANLLKKSHELTANLLQLKDLMHSLRCKIEVAEKKDHPKLYLWSKPWENETTNNEFHDNKNKELKDISHISPIKDISHMSPMKDHLVNDLASDNTNMKDAQNISNSNSIESQTSDGKCDIADGSTPSNIFSNLLSSPGGTSLELPITNSELETLAKTVQFSAPQPEAAIESSECRVRLLQHIERTQLLLEARLDSIEAQIAELESQDPSTGDDETPEHYPRTKQTIQMLLRDLTTLEELGTMS